MAPPTITTSSPRDPETRPMLTAGGAMCHAPVRPVGTTERGRQMLRMLNSMFDAWQSRPMKLSDSE